MEVGVHGRVDDVEGGPALRRAGSDRKLCMTEHYALHAVEFITLCRYPFFCLRFRGESLPSH